MGVVNAYQHPGQLGSDRWLALIAVRRLLGSRHACIVDCGTAVTIDWLRADGQHLGGFILPGLDAMIAALVRETRLELPAQLADFRQPGAGTSTRDCVGRGALLAISGAIESSAALLSAQLDARVTCVLTGGGAEGVARWLSTECHLEPDAVLRGLAVWAQDRDLAEGSR
jgi:type III pantothenate kinase